MNEQVLFNHEKTANYLGVAKQTLYNWRHKRLGPDYILIGSRKPMYLKDDLDQYINARRINLNGGVQS